jgi:hypothetical protein
VLLIHIKNEQYTASWMSSTRLLGARVNKGAQKPPSVGYMEPLWGRKTLSRGKEYVPMSEQAKKVKHKNIPEWAQGLYYNSGLMSEVLVYYDEEAIYFEHKGKESGIVRFTFEMIEGLKIVEEEGEGQDSPPQ